MFNLIVMDSISLSPKTNSDIIIIESYKIFDYTDIEIENIIMKTGKILIAEYNKDNMTDIIFNKLKWALALSQLMKYDCLFMEKPFKNNKQFARLGKITDFSILNGKLSPDIEINVNFDSTLPTLSIQYIEDISEKLQIRIEELELLCSHWAVKNVDLFKVLFRDLSVKESITNL